MTLTPDEGARSPWVSVWFSPRLTIERLVATRPTYLVWPLAILGTVASLYNQISVIDGATYLLNWQLALGLVLLGILVGIAWLYLAGLLLSWIGRLLGGRAPALHLRAAFAWSSVPTILGFIVIVAIGAANGRGTALDLVPLLVAASSLWSLIVFLLMLGRIEHFGFWRTILTYVFNLVMELAAALFIRGLLYQPFNIPSASMSPTLLVGDYVLVSKFAYGYSHFSPPFSAPLPSGRIFSAEPTPGDVVVFRVSKDQAVDYVKRVVGLPGDRIQMKQGRLYINDTPVKREPLARIFDDGACGSASGTSARRWQETLSNNVTYETLDCVDNSFLDSTDVYTVPEGHFFMLGDNRDNSTDSRVLSQVGYVPFDNLIGRVSLIFFSREDGGGAPARVRTDRIGKLVR
jgi:signal peptidase I